MKPKKSQTCLSCPQLLFRCSILLFMLLTLAMFMLLNDHEEFEDSEEKMRKRHSALDRFADEDEELDNYVMHVDPKDAKSWNLNDSHIHIVTVTCGGRTRVNQTLLSLKSVILLSMKTVHFHVFADTDLHEEIFTQMSSIPDRYRKKFVFSVYPVDYPGRNQDDWRALFKPCSSFRLFLPDVLTGLDHVIYLDTDTLNLAPIDHLYAFFKRFNQNHSIALSPEGLDSNAWYPRYALHPYYGKTGLNSGVMLMNLTRLRHVKWTDDIVSIYKEHKYNLVYGDQDIINVWGHDHPERVMQLPCEFNYVSNFCLFGHQCHSAETRGVQIIHGNRGVFHKPDRPFFRRVYQVFSEYDYDVDLKHGILDRLVAEMSRPPRQGCGKASHIFYKGYELFAKEHPELVSEKVE